jgi:hypothetical protein
MGGDIAHQQGRQHTAECFEIKFPPSRSANFSLLLRASVMAAIAGVSREAALP